MHVRIRGRRGGGRPAADLRAAPLLRGAAARPALHRAAGHHRAHLRHLPRRVPDERVRRDRGRLRSRRSTARFGRCGACIYCGEWIESHALHVFMLHAPDFLGYESAIEMAQRPPRDRRARPAAEEGRQRLIMRWSAGARCIPINVRLAASTGRPPSASCALLVSRSSGPARTRSRRSAGRRPRLSRPRAGLRVRGAALRPRASTRSTAAGSFPTAGSTSALPSSTSTSSRSTSPTPTRCTRRLRERGSYLVGSAGPLRAQLRPALAPGARGGERGRASAGSAATRSRASSCAASRSSTRSTRRCGSSTATRSPTGRRST